MIALVLFCLLGAIVATPSANECDMYCTNITATCTGMNTQFADPATANFNVCPTACQTYPNNASLAMTGDSWECRMYHLGAAQGSASNANTHCVHAGFSGGNGVCGTFCDAYCDNIMTACTGAHLVFEDRAHCLQECKWYPINATFDNSADEIPFDNSINCRSWHSQIALATVNGGDSTGGGHCEHAAPQGDNLCGTPCDNYCNTVMSTCTGSRKQWLSNDQCMSVCMTWTQGGVADPLDPTTSGADLPCRKYHAVVADTDPATHCIHSGPLGGSGVCGTACDGYCDIMSMTNCGWSSSECYAACGNLTASDTTSTQDILNKHAAKGSVGCGTYYAIAALDDDTMCAKAMAAQDCGALLVKASWTVLAVVLLALGFSS